MKIQGFIDSHLHFLGIGYIKSNIELEQTKSIVEVTKLLKQNLDRKILIGRGWNQENFAEKRMPNKQDLNAVSKDKPIVLVRVCGHVIVVNDKMLELAAIGKDSKQIEGGTFSFETGIFTERALGLIYNKMPKTTKDDIRNYLLIADKILLENGVTSCASDDFCILPVDYELVIETMRELYEEGLLHIKVTEQVNLPYHKLQDFINEGYVNKNFGKLKMGPLKILGDGSLGGKTAALKAPYEGEPENYGIKSYTDDELFALVHLADRNKMDTVIHAIGDAAIEQAIDALKKTIKITGRKDHAHAIIHAQLTTKDQIKRMKRLNIGSIIQPIFLNSDIQIIKERIGSRANESYLFWTMHKEGLRTGFSTDAPVEPVNPFFNIYSAISRRSIKNPNLTPFLQGEAYDLETSLKAYTKANLPFIYEKELNPRDYIIIDSDIDKIQIDEIKSIKVLETYIDGELVYKR